ncbi:MAG: rRNA pseudouridine synthase [Alistipes sp.]|nr:rRNA pseudouridine synthase [Alistipes sp.]
MKDYKNDSTDTLQRFGRDKRARIVRTELAQPAPRRDRPERYAKESDNRSEQPRRRSFNPNFTDDNRPARSMQPRTEHTSGYGRSRREDKPFSRSEYGSRSERPARFEKPARKFAKNDGEKTYQTKKVYTKSIKTAANDKPKTYPKYKPETVEGAIRLNRFIAQSGLCSRREADEFITAGVVTVNGAVVTELGTKVLPTDDVRFNNEPVKGEQNVYLVLNKPKGYVTTLDDPHASKIVTDLVKNACKERIYPVGRLDKNSLGLLLFTNDGALTKQLTHPSYQKKKIYQVTLDKPLSEQDMDKIADGINLEDGEIYADEIACIKDDRKEIGIEIHSGRNRIVRRIFEHLGYEVRKLDRVYYAGLTKKNLKRGAWRFLTKDEVTRLKTGMYD